MNKYNDFIKEWISNKSGIDINDIKSNLGMFEEDYIDSLSALENSLNNSSANDDNGVSFNFNYWGWWHIKLPNSNKITIPDLKDTNSFSWLWSYNKINDNNSWECNQFFCIVVNFVVSKHNALDYSIDKSIENKVLVTVAPDGYLKRIKWYFLLLATILIYYENIISTSRN